LRAGDLGLGGLIIVLLLSWFTGIDFLSLVSTGPDAPSSSTASTPGRVQTIPEEERLVDFVDAVMRDVQQTWSALMPQEYRPTRAVLFRDAIDSACGFARSAMGPFYCPGDQTVYLDLGFYDELRSRFGAPGDFAQAYVLAHELGHHVQDLLGIERQVRSAQRSDPSQVNAMSVRLELQADCFAGVWGHTAAQPGRAAKGEIELEPRDVNEGLNAAAVNPCPAASSYGLTGVSRRS
jgi:uncharacterized protein